MYMHIGKLEKTKMYIWSKEFKTCGGLIQQFHFELGKDENCKFELEFVCMYVYATLLLYLILYT